MASVACGADTESNTIAAEERIDGSLITDVCRSPHRFTCKEKQFYAHGGHGTCMVHGAWCQVPGRT